MATLTAYDIHKPPFSFEAIESVTRSGYRYRIRDSKDNTLGNSYVQENAELIVAALNEYYRNRVPGRNPNGNG